MSAGVVMAVGPLLTDRKESKLRAAIREVVWDVGTDNEDIRASDDEAVDRIINAFVRYGGPLSRGEET